MTADRATGSHLAGLNGLRALACLAVFGVHFHQKTGVAGNLGPIDFARLLENGNTGVAMFFILSGFLLSLPYWSGQQPTGFTGRAVKTYTLKRLARILPAYYLCLSALVLIHGHGSGPRQLMDTTLHYFFLHNYTEFSFYSLNTPFWTIAVQAQFYLLLPLLMIVLRPLGARKTAAFMVVLALGAGAFACHYWLMTQAQSMDRWPLPQQFVQRDGAVLTRSLLAHLPHFLLGFLAGHVSVTMSRASQSNTPTKPWLCEIIFGVSAVAIIAILGTDLDDRFTLPHGRYNLPVVPLLIAAMIVCAPATVFARSLLESYPLRMLGLVSYGVYVYHLPCMNVTARLMNYWQISPTDRWLAFALLSFAVTIAVAAGSYMIVERPILRATGRATRTG